MDLKMRVNIPAFELTNRLESQVSIRPRYRSSPGGWVTVGLFGLQVVIWIITPDALEKWIDHSAFGKKRGTGGYKDAKDQEEHLRSALVEMGLAQ